MGCPQGLTVIRQGVVAGKGSVPARYRRGGEAGRSNCHEGMHHAPENERRCRGFHANCHDGRATLLKIKVFTVTFTLTGGK